MEEWKFCRNTTHIRCRKMPLAAGKFSYVHISKNAGVSWIQELRKLKQTPRGLPGYYVKGIKLFPKTGLYPYAVSGAEHGVLLQDELLNEHRPFFRLLTLRSPRHEIWSMFSHCYYSEWGKKATKDDEHFPRSHADENDLIDFELWLDEFLDDSKEHLLGPNGRGYSLACYHPQNFQSRFLTSSQFEPRRPRPWEIVPDSQKVEQNYWSFDWVALTSFFHESKCLLYYRLDTTNSSANVSQMVSDYLDQTCHCDVPANTEGAHSKMDINAFHSSKGKRATLLDLPPSILRKMDIVSQVDLAFFQTALQQFLNEIVWLESELKRRVLCDPVLEKWGNELSYLPFLASASLSARYHEIRKLASLER